VNILARVRVVLLGRELSALRRADHADRDVAETNIDMMRRMVKRAQRIAELQIAISGLCGAEAEATDSFMSPTIPTGIGIVTQGEYKKFREDCPTLPEKRHDI